MKKLLLLLVFISGFAFGQLSQDSIQSIAKTYFEKEYVQQTFKDPYSYELKKIWSEPITKEVSLQENIVKSQMIYSNKIFPKKMRQAAQENEVKNKNELSQLSDPDKIKIVAYDVYFDTYGANSYGNKVLGKYMLRMNTDGNTIGKVIENKK